ncbi:MAG TPA: carboxypeptidase regulatory-like domain-containing protein [Pyrinomonadaceae bacterium]|nr:TonB-dependent receptor [Chloracidobacterium sp.]MBP9934380.1 TonB-dependent receptor [Pyrinomonadaceae bacterium]MBK9436743.1 TonB-dependent receptor [Chloracidobacterium sp.]MBL0241734.1 TonB-dependent receptor [Chloracidobacterium sp.]HQY65806.1 carboxypeptidase regulatory-like domain-containing protein [Pyrinomonadaceae bacterium]
MKSNIFVRVLSAISIVLFAFIINISAQANGKIAGTITDVNGGIIPGATVTVTNEKTGEARNVLAKEDGTFLVVNLQPAIYTVAASGSNFATATKRNIELLVGQELDLELKLQAKGVTVSVDVISGEDLIVNTASASMSANVNAREVEGLPINGRQLSQLYLQAPGGVNSGSGTFSDIRFSGRANNQNVVRYDGIEGTAIIDASPGNLNGEVPSPFRLQSSLENVQEFRVDSSNFPAEFGTGTGGQISVVTKSGGNSFHGSVFEYFRRDSLDARNFFENSSPGIDKGKLSLDQFGGSIGGPIIKDKLFFFGSYEQYRGRFGLNFVEAAPSLSLALPGAFIPGTTTPVNPLIQPFIAAFRSPNAVVIPGASAVSGFEVLQIQDNEKVNEKALAARIDYQINTYHKLYTRFFRDEGTDIAPEGISGRVTSIEAVPQNGVAGFQSILRKDGSLINDFKFGYNAARTRINGQAATVGGLDFSNLILNISGSVANTGIAGQGTSSGISIPGGLVRANSATNGRGQPYTPYSLSFVDSINWVRGNHNFKFGGEVRLIRMYTDRLGGTTYTFSNLASFLANTPTSVQYLGDVSAPSPFNNGLTGQRLAKQEYYIGYAQDEWKLKPGLTLSYGLRYEYYTPLHEANNGQVLFDINTGTLRPSSEAAFKSSKNNFGPRVALSWSPDQDGSGFFSAGKSVIRGGLGLYYGPGQTEDQIQPIESDRVSSTVTSGSLLAFPANIPGIIANFNANPNNRSYQPRAYSNDYTIPERIFQYSVSWQQQLPGGITTTLGYVGSNGSNLFLRSVANRILPGQTTIANGTNIPTGFGVINRTNPTGQVIGVTTVRQFSIVSGTTVSNPYAEIDYKTSGGDDRYNALQFSAQRSFRSGLTMNAQYTFGSSRGTTAGSNEARTSAQLENFEADRGRNNFDVRHTFNLSALYELPFGNGKRFDLGRTGNFLLGGWELGGIINARSGVPVEVLVVRPDIVVQCQQAGGCPNGAGGFFANGFVANLPSLGASFPSLPTGFVAVVNTPGGGNSRNVRRPNLIAGVNPYLNNDRNYINPAAFATPAPGTWGDLSRNELSGPSFRQVDMIVAKRFRIRETMNFEFRTEFFNIFNQTNFANPSTTISNALPNLAFNSATSIYSATSSNVIQPGQAFTQGAAGSTFGLLRSTVGRTVGLGSNRQIQFAFRFNF